MLASFFHMIESVYDETSCIWPIDFVNLFAAIIRHGRSSAKTAFEKFMAFSALGKTGKLADFDVNVAVYGAVPNGKTTAKDNPALDKIFADKFNLAAIVMKGDEIVYERYNSQKVSIAIFHCLACR